MGSIMRSHAYQNVYKYVHFCALTIPLDEAEGCMCI